MIHDYMINYLNLLVKFYIVFVNYNVFWWNNNKTRFNLIFKFENIELKSIYLWLPEVKNSL